MTRSVHHWINGRTTRSTGENVLEVSDPASGAIASIVARGTADDVDAAVSAAATAAPGWAQTSLSKRSAILFRFRELLTSHHDDMARLITAEHGKVLDDARGEVARGIENVEFACGVPHLLKGSFNHQAATGVDVHSVREPLGVVAGITPFNFPAMVPLWMVANAVACGNTFVLKPSERDPSPSVLIAELLTEAGAPPGVLNVVQGDREVVEHLLADPRVSAISFVGSTPVARHIYETGTQRGKRVQALGGAKNHMVVMPDADIDVAADAAVSAAYGSAGERCMAISVVVAVGDTGDALVDAISSRISDVQVGDGRDPSSDMGPLVTAEHRDRVASYLEPDALDGAKIVVDGRTAPLPAEGYFLGCSLVDHVRPGSKIYDEEVFGPVLSIVRVDEYDDALALVNANEYGNGAAIFTRDGRIAHDFQSNVTCGMVGINVPIPVPVSYYSFGGWKASLFGDSHIYGPEGIAFYTRGKVVTTRWPELARPGVDLGFPTTR